MNKAESMLHDGSDQVAVLQLRELKGLGIVLTLCDGNTFRSRIAAYILRELQIPSESAAVGDVSKQINKDRAPEWLLQYLNYLQNKKPLINKIDDHWAGRIKQVDLLMAACARFICVYCRLDHLPEFIEPDDPRLRQLYVEDPNNINQYPATYSEVKKKTLKFAREYNRILGSGDYWKIFYHLYDGPRKYGYLSNEDRISLIRNTPLPTTWDPLLNDIYIKHY